MTPQETEKKVRKPKKQPLQTLDEAVEAQKKPKRRPKVMTTQQDFEDILDNAEGVIETVETHYTTLEPLLERVELLASRRTDKEAKALLTGISMGLNHALGKGTLVERSGRFYLTTSTDEL